MIQKAYADSTQINYAYSPYSGLLESVTDAEHQVKAYGYDVDNALTNISYSGSVIPTPAVSLFYDASYPRLRQMFDGTGQTAFEYNSITVPPAAGDGRLAVVFNYFNSEEAGSSITYNYDAVGRMNFEYLDDNLEQFAFDALGRLSTHSSPLGIFTNLYNGLMDRPSSIAGPVVATSYSYYGNSGDQRLSGMSYGGVDTGDGSGVIANTAASYIQQLSF